MAAGMITGIRERCAGVGAIASANSSTSAPREIWKWEQFAREQIRGLVRQIFLQKVPQEARLVVFGATGPEIDVEEICLQVGQCLADERVGDIAIVRPGSLGLARGNVPLKESGIPLNRNLWLLEEKGCGSRAAAEELYAYLSAVRAEFEYSIIVASTAEHLNPIVEAARFSDGVVLVLSAMRTRRVSALRMKRSLEQAGVRLLGTVLADREFPIPQRLYRHL